MIKNLKLLLFVGLVCSVQISVAQNSDSLTKKADDTKTVSDDLEAAIEKARKALADSSLNAEAVAELDSSIEATKNSLTTFTSAENAEPGDSSKGGSVDDILPFENSDYISLYDSTFGGLQALEKTFGKYEVYMNGENHTFTESNARLWLKMIKYLHANAGVRNIMFEYGYSYGALVNRYLESGDTSLYNSIEKFAYIEYSQVLKDLQEFNQGLPEDEKLYFTGIDVERGVYPIVKLLSVLLPADSVAAPDSIALHTQSINSLAYYNDYKLDNKNESSVSLRYNLGFQFKTIGSLDMLHQNFIKFEDEYKAYLGDNFDEFKLVIYDNYKVRKTWFEYEQAKAVQEYIYRENYMHQRFAEESSSHAGAWFGQFGRCHTTQSKQEANACEWFQFKSLTSRIENTVGGRFKDKILSIAIIYENDRKLGKDNEYLDSHFDSYFDDMAKDEIVLLDIERDSVLYKAFKNDYNYIFFSTHNTRGEVYSSSLDYADDYDDDFGGFFTLGLTNNTFDFTNLNSRMGNYPFNNLQQMISISGGATIEEFGMVYEVDLSILRAQHNVLNSSRTISLRGFSYMSYYLFDLARNEKWVDLNLGGGLGYGNLNLKDDAESLNTNYINSGFLGLSKVTKHNNPALMVGAAGKLEVNIKWLKVGYLARYVYDFSNKQWMSGRKRVEGGPLTSFTNWSHGFFVGFVFQD